MEARQRLGMAGEGQVVALLPGSRMSELKYLSKTMIESALWLTQRHPCLRFVTPLAGRETGEFFRSVLNEIGADLEIQLFTAARGCDGCIRRCFDCIWYGFLEAMLLKRPMVVIYRTTALSYAILKRWWVPTLHMLPFRTCWHAKKLFRSFCKMPQPPKTSGKSA